MIKNNFALIIPTKNRPKCIEIYLEKKIDIFNKLCIDVLIIDSSKNLETKNIVNYFNELYENIIYEKYVEKQEVLSIDDKVFEICKKYHKKYNYILFSSDRTIINIEKIYSDIIFLFQENIDFIIHDNGEKTLKYYEDSLFLLKEWGWRTTSLSSIIFSSKFLENAMNNFSPRNENFKGLWLMSTVFHLISEKKFKSVVFCEKDIWISNMNGEDSFWITSGNVFFQWGKNWCDVIDTYPKYYDSVKEEVILSHCENTKLFSLIGLLRMKTTNNLKLKDLIKYSKYIKRVTKTNILVFYLLAILPIKNILKILRKIYIKNKN